MQKKRTTWFFFLGLLCISMVLSGVQREKKSPRRMHFSLSAQYMAGLTEESKSISYNEDVYSEKADYQLGYAVKKGNAYGLGLRYLFGKSIGIELGLGYGQRDITAAITASIPHPLWMNTPRKAQESVSGLSMKEFDIFLNVVYAPRFGKLSLALYAGPGLLMARANILESVSFKEKSYPYTDFTVVQPQVTIASNVFGWDAGLEVGYSFIKSLTLILNACYVGSRASFDPKGEWPPLTLTLGGFRAGTGLRFNL